MANITKEINNIQITNIFNNISNSDTLNEYPIICTYYSVDNGYKKVYDNLEASLKYHKLPYYAFEILRKSNTWELICQQKPHFILEIMNMFPDRNIVWLDSDAVVKRLPTMFLNINKDIAANILGGTELNSATLFFKNSVTSRNILNDWIVKSKIVGPQVWDQKILHSVINEKYKDYFFNLPIEYTGIFDHPLCNNKNIVIAQYQASRKLKHVNGAPV